jgi:hypothetical protein
VAAGARPSLRASGYRNRQNFRHAIYFHLGGLDLYPEALKISPLESLKRPILLTPGSRQPLRRPACLVFDGR